MDVHAPVHTLHMYTPLFSKGPMFYGRSVKKLFCHMYVYECLSLSELICCTCMKTEGKLILTIPSERLFMFTGSGKRVWLGF